MSQIRVTDKRLIPQIKLYLEQSAGTLITESDAFEYILRKFPEYRRKNQVLAAKEVARAYTIARNSLANGSDNVSLVGNDNTSTETSPVPQLSDSDSVKKKKRSKQQNSPLSLNDNLHAAYTTVDKIADDKERAGESQSKRAKVGSDNDSFRTWKRPEERFISLKLCDSDLAGIDNVLQDIKELIWYPLRRPEIYNEIGIVPPRGILLYGPPGCGKTLLARAIGGEMGIPMVCVSAPEIVSGMSGESEENLRKLFDDAIAMAPSLIFIDEIDAITGKRDSTSRSMERRIVAQLQTCMDSLNNHDLREKPVMIIGATNRPDALDNALRRAGRFDREISLGIPDETAREAILRLLTKQMKVAEDVDYSILAAKTPGYEAAIIAVNRIFHELFTQPLDSQATTESMEIEIPVGDDTSSEKLPEEQLKLLSVEMNDFELALKKVQPSSKREGFVTVPNTTWDDIGALKTVREKLRVSVVEPIRNPQLFKKMGLTMPAGVLLYGPPGCGKTLLAKAVSNESRANFISIKGPELLNKYVGESERGVRQVFERARASSPCVIFFDEIDALVPKRGMDGGSSGVSERMVNMLLTEMDGLEDRKQVFVIAATNRPDIIDPAMLRPGRLDQLLLVPLPTQSDRLDILRTITKKTPLADDVDLEKIAFDSRCDRFSGADLSNLVREAALTAIRPSLLSGEPAPSFVTQANFETALSVVKPSVSKDDLEKYCREPNMRGALE